MCDTLRWLTLHRAHPPCHRCLCSALCSVHCPWKCSKVSFLTKKFYVFRGLFLDHFCHGLQSHKRTRRWQQNVYFRTIQGWFEKKNNKKQQQTKQKQKQTQNKKQNKTKKKNKQTNKPAETFCVPSVYKM